MKKLKIGQAFHMGKTNLHWECKVYPPRLVALYWAEVVSHDCRRIAENLEKLTSESRRQTESDSIVVGVKEGSTTTSYVALHLDVETKLWMVFEAVDRRRVRRL